MKSALVTGASSGIGLATARAMVERGWRVVMLAHLQHELDQALQGLPSERAYPWLCDLSQPAQMQTLWERCEALHGPLDVLVNNAGVGHHGDVVSTAPEQLRCIMEVNFFAAAELCRQAATAMIGRGGGHIVNLTSASARRPLARMGAYGASKAALHGFTQALRVEVAGTGVRVSEVLPISVATPFFERASNTSRHVYKARGLQQTPEQIARLILECLDRNLAERVSHRPTGWLLALDVLAPNLVARLMDWWERRHNPKPVQGQP